MMIIFKIECASGTLAIGGSSDFLVCVSKARDSKRNCKLLLPASTLRVQFFYPNNSRVSSQEVKAALRALSSEAIAATVALRRVAVPQKAPARSEARTAAFLGTGGEFLAPVVASAFCQAGVVAPPDSPDLGNSLFFKTFGRSAVTDVKISVKRSR